MPKPGVSAALQTALPSLSLLFGPTRDRCLKLFMDNLNPVIEEYNQIKTVSARKDALKNIAATIKEFEEQYPPSFYAQSPAYQEEHAQLYSEMQKQLESLGVASFLDLTGDDGIEKPEINQVIANMSPKKLNEFSAVLNKKQSYIELTTALDTLYDERDTSDEAERFRDFFADHTIRFLGGGKLKKLFGRKFR